MVNDGLAAIAVLILFLDHGRRIARFALLDHRGAVTVAIAVTIVDFPDADAGADRSDANTNLIRERRRSKSHR